MNPKFSIIVAIDIDGGIGKDGKIPWYCPNDLKYFKSITLNGVVIMGRRTWESLPIKPLPNRINIVVSKTIENIDENINKIPPYIAKDSFIDALKFASNYNKPIFVIGGGILYTEAILHGGLEKVMITRIPKRYECDCFFPDKLEINPMFRLESSKGVICLLQKNPLKYYGEYNESEMTKITIETYQRTPEIIKDEYQYLNCMRRIMMTGSERETRNGLVKSRFGEHLEFDLKLGFPIITTKKVWFRGIVEELLYFVRGDTDTKILEEKGVKIWSQNTTQENLSALSLDYPEGMMGPMYGYNWRFFGFNYNPLVEKNISLAERLKFNEGLDQLEKCLKTLQEDPMSRRILMTSYNPLVVDQGCLPPCHGISIQFYVEEINNIRYLSCKMEQRSADVFLGLVWNISSYATMMHMMATVLTKRTKVQYCVDRLIMNLGDAHIYQSHYDAVKIQLTRTPYSFPKLNVLRKRRYMEDFQYEDFELENYQHHSSITASMML